MYDIKHPEFTVALIGNPNAGKSTLFNALTGSHQHVGNWPGVTVEQKFGFFKIDHVTVKIIDLPGVNTLSTISDARAIDEQIAVDYLLNEKPNVIINVVDASSLERSLYLTTQLLELNIPVIVVANMMDVAKKQGLLVDLHQIEKELKTTVIPAVSNRKIGIDQIKTVILNIANSVKSISSHVVDYPESIESAFLSISHLLQEKQYPRFLAMRLLEGDWAVQKYCSNEIKQVAHEKKQQIESFFKEDFDILIADYGYQKIHDIVEKTVVKVKTVQQTLTDKVDAVLLNRFLAIPFFLLIMYLMFTFAINMGGAFQDFFDLSSAAIFVHGVSNGLTSWHWPSWLITLISSGIGNGITTTVTFIPVIGAMFLFLSFLEDSGYLARAAFVMDRFMCAIGLPGKAFIPMIIGFGCNVPAIMAARTLENENDRILTILITPFISCSARLAIYAVFVAAFFPKGGQNIVFLLYLIGIFVAVGSGIIFRKTLLKGNISHLVMEMPLYHAPHFGKLLKHTWYRLKSFIFKAGSIIVLVSLIVSALNVMTLNSQESLLEKTGKIITPAFKPMGISEENWPATVGLVTGIMAKEVVIGTLNTLYSQSDFQAASSQKKAVLPELTTAVGTIFENIKRMSYNLIRPIYASIPNQKLQGNTYGEMMRKFGGPVSAFAYLLFVLLYFPCAASIGVIAQELNKRWAVFSVCWTVFVAYGVSVLFYQTATYTKHPFGSLVWIGSILMTIMVVIWILKGVHFRRKT